MLQSFEAYHRIEGAVFARFAERFTIVKDEPDVVSLEVAIGDSEGVLIAIDADDFAGHCGS